MVLGRRVKWSRTCTVASLGTSSSNPTVQIFEASFLQVLSRSPSKIRFLDRSIGSITAGSQWLVWNFQSDSTLAAAIEGRLGQFPACLSEYYLQNPDRFDEDERDFKVASSDHPPPIVPSDGAVDHEADRDRGTETTFHRHCASRCEA